MDKQLFTYLIIQLTDWSNYDVLGNKSWNFTAGNTKPTTGYNPQIVTE
jgi:hypothetical protein